MFSNTTSFAVLFILSCSLLKAQDSLVFFNQYRNQYHAERTLKSQLYCNPASMSDYSAVSFSEFGAGYHSEQKDIYRQQLGAGEQGLEIYARSFQKLNSRRAVWGKAGYESLKQLKLKWNENLDFDRVAPYVLADSVGGDLKLERYSFAGGYSEKINRFTLGIEASYTAQLGYRSRDPRINNSTSDLWVNLGINYKAFREYEVGVFTRLNKYTQNSSISFVSLLGNAYVYQMVGLGYSNNFFNGGKNAVAFEELGYQVGVQIMNKGGKDFYLHALAGNAKNTKNIQISNPFYESSELSNEQFIFEGAKFFDLNMHHRFGVFAGYAASVKTGTEFGYSVNTQFTEQVFQRKAYRKEDYSSTVKLMYQYSTDHFTLNATPFFGHQEIKERRLYPVSGQKFVYNYLGISADVQQRLNENQVLSFSPYFIKRMVDRSISALSSTTNAAINDWIQQEYYFQASGISTFGASLRYDVKPDKLPAFFISTQYQSQKMLQKNNNLIGIRLGITF